MISFSFFIGRIQSLRTPLANAKRTSLRVDDIKNARNGPIKLVPRNSNVDPLKDEKFKVQASIMDDIVRVSGKKIDDLQAVIQASKNWDLGFALQYVNMKN